MTESTDKIRALFLTALMVFSIFAGTVAFAGTAAAASTNTDTVDSVSAEAIDTTADGTAEISVQLNNSASNASIALYDSSGDRVFTSVGDRDDLVDSVSTTNNVSTFTVNVTELSDETFELGEGTVYANATMSGSGTAPSDTNFDGSTSVSLGGLEVTDLTIPRVAANDTQVEAEVTVENTGSASVTQNVSFLASANASSASGAQVNLTNAEFNATPQEVVVDGGNSEPVEFLVDTSQLPNSSENASHYEVAGYTSGSPFSAQTANFLVGSSEQGSTSITVVDQNSNSLEGVTVDLYLRDDYQAGPVVESLQTNDQGRVTFSDLAVGAASNNPINYVAVAGNQTDILESTTTTISLFEPTQTSDSSTVTLRSALEPQNVSVAAWNEQSESVTGNISTLLADGSVDNTATYVVYSQTQGDTAQNQPVNSDVQVDLTTSAIDPTGLNVANFVDENGNDAGQSLSVTITPDSETTTINGETYSYETFRVSAVGANESTMTTGTINPVVLNQINADAGTDVANDATDAAQVQYVLEGEEAISGEVYNRDGESIEGATVWAAYEGSNQSVEFSEETFVNEDGEPFLATTTNADGDYVIPGLAGDNTSVTIYATAQGYNRLNLTDTSVDRFVAAEEAEQTGGPDELSEEHNLVLTGIEVTPEYRVTLSAEDSDGNFADSIDMPIVSERDVQVTVEVKADNEPDSAFTPIENSTLTNEVEVDFSSSNTVIGAVADDPLTADSGTSTTSFESTRSTGTTTLTANVTNDEGTTFSDTAEIEVFGVGEITGQIINDEEPADNLPNATVTLFRVESNGTETELRSTQTGPDGSYSFTNVETSETYRVEGEFDGSTGFTEVIKNSAGTSNADVVIVDVAPDPANFQVSDLSPTNVTVPQGTSINVTANVTNDGDESGTQTVEFRVAGTALADEEVALNGGETQSVEFTNIDTSGLAAGNYTHGVYTADGEQTATLTVESSGADETDITDVLSVIEQYNNGNADITEVLSAIEQYNNS
ncbi:carboxypeptidase-like regulatory domain-containing protein [Halorubrum ezzemoulense]|uniref:carboxypeptidase-like regulatory domain-containing protein n=1 Tax=Halorubrum ezzemoulense TaxID=337243 RepID=UPI00232BB4D6|nr:carboxypeptidase-like regulatory domain-containing protein [Halorubrum ezzemoulense]MDB2265823.1 carboxypeptidase-like regulatory domain-containing protein [Halorubrum ezzemoulense]